MAEPQVIPAKHGVATFVPAGQTIKIINTSGTQVVDTWAFALPKPDGEKDADKQEKPEEKEEPKQEEKPAPEATPKKSAKKSDLPSQEDAEKATQEGLKKSDETGKDGKDATPQKSTWSSYVPSLGLGSSAKKGNETPKKGETEQQKNSRTWGSYFPSGKGFSSYIPKSAGDTVSAFAQDVSVERSDSIEVRTLTKRSTSEIPRSPISNNSQTFRRRPWERQVSKVQSLGRRNPALTSLTGFAAATGSGYGGALYAGYSAWNSTHAGDAPSMEFMSMPHSRAATLHMRPKVNDTLVSNLREPMLVLVEDTSPGIHDTLMAACDPQRYKGLGVDDWEHHGSCAENLVLALKELNERAGLKGAKAIGADVTINVVPAPLNLFMNIPWDDDGDLGFMAPKGKEGDYVRLKAERDMVVVMSACPQDVLEINAKKPTDAHFLVENPEENTKEKPKAQPAKKRPPPKKIGSSRSPSVATTEAGGDDKSAPAKKPVPKRAPPPKKPAGTTEPAPQKKPAPKAVQPPKKTPAEGETNGEAPAPAEKKKPRKLAPRPKPAAPKAEEAGEKTES
ncbi:hypothetical protein LTR36_002454 [Oleoguttula mirabilis]|uniref:DUF1989 domain-containing protein n=1 Tax=Oleoguttula mirabilis TaxID=1507867 RepID=A0AAV9JKV4_9PEZI|nr:hypothetical protein LTR36_002454 [Oleoguttula mirabilis]